MTLESNPSPPHYSESRNSDSDQQCLLCWT
jgi:hypothetical protein